MRTLVKEPLLHFLLAGTLLFAAHGFLNRGTEEAVSDPRREVRVSAGDLEWLAETWARQWQRRPDEGELRELVAGYVREEMLAREARKLGLDEHDTVVRRRLAQKMEFLLEDTARLAEPDEAELRRLYDTHRDRHRTPARVSFTQIPFETERAARDGLDALAMRPAEDLGDGGVLEREHVLVDERVVTALFGEEFARHVLGLDAGAWHGPIPSAYGFHLVRIGERRAARQRPFEEVRSHVLDEWRALRQAEADERHLAALLENYDVVVEEGAVSLIGPLARAVR